MAELAFASAAAAGFVGAAAVEALKKVSSLVSREVVRGWGYEDKLADLHRTLELINAVLEDAEKKKSTRPVMVWLKQLKQVVDEADDVLDEIDYEKLSREVNVSSLSSLKKLSFRNEIFRIEMGKKINNISRMLCEINKLANGLGLQNEKHVAPISVKGSNVWDLEEEGDRVQNSLKPSFDHLPNSTVKQCFLYCSIYRKDKVLKKEELIRLWMALGLVQADERRNKEAEEVGNDIFQILVNNSLFEDVKTDECGYVTGCMDDLVHDLSLSLCKDESLCLVDPTNDDIERIPQVIKHLSVLSKDRTGRIPGKDLCLVLSKNNISSTLHTLIFKGKELNSISFDSLKKLRILKLKGSGLENIDDSIGELVHLRYLHLSNSEMKTLPNSIGKLYHLQTLNLLGCYSLKKFPQDMNNLVSLRHLMYEPRVNIPISNVGRLTSLRTLPSFTVGQEKSCQVSELGPLKHLAGELRITNLEKIKSKKDAAKADLSNKINLHEICFCWSRNGGQRGVNRKDKDVLEGLQPHGNLKILTIQDFSSDKFPVWVEKMVIDDIEGKSTPLHKLVKIKLSGCNNCVSLPMLEDLPFLQDLVLEKMDNLTCLSNALGKHLSPSLRSLELSQMRRLERWNIDPETTNSSIMLSPVLKELTVIKCPGIIHLDECHPHPLVSLKIHDCENLVSITSIQGLTSLETLDIIGCPSLLEIPYLHNSSPKHHHHPLKSLCITECTKLTSFPCKSFNCFSFLKALELGPFSEKLHSFPSLQGIENLRNLSSLTLYGWDHWESIPEQVQHLTSLASLFISGFGMQELPTWLVIMSFTTQVTFYDCFRLNKETIEGARAGISNESGVAYPAAFQIRFY